MRLHIFLAIVLMAYAGASFAQTAAQHQTPNEQALGVKLMQEIQGGLSCNANLITVQAELVKANARVKELEPKPEKKE